MSRIAAPFAEIRLAGNDLALLSTYDAGLVAAIKAEIPASARKWDMQHKAWIVTSQFGPQLAQIVQRTLGIAVTLPLPTMTPPTAALTRVIRLEYLGQAKDRGDGTLTAFGYDGAGWGFVFPLAVLKVWFAEDAKPDEAVTLYGVLGIKQAATVDELKSAYRRAARTYHPDLNHEPDAAEQFKRIQAAYEILRDPNKRAKYNAGLALTRAVPRAAAPNGPMWRAPLRCGLLLVEATEQVGRLAVTRILAWNDIVNAQGQTLVTSWPAGATEPTQRWV